MPERITRRQAVRSVAMAPLLGSAWAADCLARANDKPSFRLATFRADVTPRLGHPLLGGHFQPARSVDDPLYAHGLVLLGPGKPIVLVAIDWCEIRNDAHQRWRTVLAEAAETTTDRVLVASVHQHDAPLADLAAERLLRQHQVDGHICDPDFHERCVQHLAGALREAVTASRPVTHVGLGQAKVAEVASNRRIVDAQGNVSFGRYSRTVDPTLKNLPDGTIDPWLKTLSFWDGQQALAAVSAYATHPMSYYGGGAISSDFVGLARQRRQQDDPRVAQIYLSGCSGDVTAGKYNDGTPQSRKQLTDRLYQAMVAAWEATRRYPLERVEARNVPMILPHRDAPGFTLDDLQKQLADESLSMDKRAMAAMGLSTRAHHPDGHKTDLQVIDLGCAQMVLLPGESFVAYQLAAQQVRPDSFVMAIGYGECSPGYIPTEQAIREGFVKQHGSWCWVAPGAEEVISGTLRKALQGSPGD